MRSRSANGPNQSGVELLLRPLLSVFIGLPCVCQEGSNSLSPFRRPHSRSFMSQIWILACRAIINGAQYLLPEWVTGFHLTTRQGTRDQACKLQSSQLPAGYDTNLLLSLQAEAVERCMVGGRAADATSEPHCGICLDAFTDTDHEPVIDLPCHSTHAFHAACLARAWRVAGHARCPLCRCDCCQLWPCVMNHLQHTEPKSPPTEWALTNLPLTTS